MVAAVRRTPRRQPFTSAGAAVSVSAITGPTSGGTLSTLDHPRDGGSARIDPPGGSSTPWEETQATPEFQQLRRALRRFVFPATVLFLAWYTLYVLMSAYARGFMATKLLGNINVAYVFGLLQFISTFVIAYVYAKYADKNLDPTADRIRSRIEGGAR